MVQQSGSDEPEPAGLAFVRMMVREFVRDVRYPTALTVRYLRCDGCGQVTTHSTDQRSISIMPERELTAAPPEAVCDECGHAQPRMVGDELPAEMTVTCVGRRYRRIRAGRSRRPCGQEFAVPATAPRVLCLWCSTVQPGPGEPANP
ncbi:hypothetical protein [Phytohabitans rumicis]|uniref:Uncharacterized protein n=1 Tax=Phytohabitans rumicis TaxID=1076125 RepID=A0A6V8LKJ9_9ACTN|nr:hypothetical protein [Phytohabitans rumicis]GFJ93165.1 hypothetical protein Prum_068070 [Phytohabitans rumicis]